MNFVDKPPPAIGEVVYSWTNNGPSGPRPDPLSVRLMIIGIPAGAGFVLGLIGFFVIGGILEHRGARVSADWFLLSLGIGTALGAAVGLYFALRPVPMVTRYVGKDGCAQIAGGKLDLLDFGEVEAIRAHVSVMTFRGIRTSVREFHVKSKGKERLWFVSSAPGEKKKDDPNYDFGEAVLRAFEEGRQPQ